MASKKKTHAADLGASDDVMEAPAASVVLDDASVSAPEPEVEHPVAMEALLADLNDKAAANIDHPEASPVPSGKVRCRVHTGSYQAERLYPTGAEVMVPAVELAKLAHCLAPITD